MPRASKDKKALKDLPWEDIMPLVNLVRQEAVPALMDAEEYTGEDGITLEEHNTNVARYNTSVIKTHRLAQAEAQENIDTLYDKIMHKDTISDLIAFWGMEQFKPILSAEGQVQVRDTLVRIAISAAEGRIKYNTGEPVSGKALQGMIEYMKTDPRSKIFKPPSGVTAVMEGGHIYSVCRPLLMSAWKLYHGIQYSQYDYESKEMGLILGKELLDYVGYMYRDFDWTTDELLQLREEAIAKSRYKAAHNTTTINTLSDDDFNELPRLVKLELLQLWVYQAQLYKPYALMNLTNPDRPRDPFVDVEMFVPTPKPKKPPKPKKEFDVDNSQDIWGIKNG